MFGQTSTSPNSHTDVTSRLVGPSVEVEICIEDVPCRCLIDTGSQVTTVLDGFYMKHLSHIPLNPLDTLLDVKGANDVTQVT